MTKKELIKAILTWSQTVELDHNDRKIIGEMINLVEEFED